MLSDNKNKQKETKRKKAIFVVTATKDIVIKYKLHLGNIMKAIARDLGGTAGGRDDHAEGSIPKDNLHILESTFTSKLETHIKKMNDEKSSDESSNV